MLAWSLGSPLLRGGQTKSLSLSIVWNYFQPHIHPNVSYKEKGFCIEVAN